MEKPKAEVFLITLEEHQLGYDLRITSGSASVADMLTALDAFAHKHLANCRGCDGCCHERAPLTAPDIAALAALLPTAGPYPAQAVCQAFANVYCDKNGIVDITLRRDKEGACLFLHKEGKYCQHWPARPFVCRSHFCLPRSNRLEAARAAITNRGEDELIRQLIRDQTPQGAFSAASSGIHLAPEDRRQKKANIGHGNTNAPPLLPPNVDPAHYPPDPAFAAGGWETILIKDIVTPELWIELQRET
jgi:Fe-S-cluster containining protein